MMWRLLACLLLVPQWSFADEALLSYGIEDYYWEEFGSDGKSLLNESGIRHVLTYAVERPVDREWLVDATGRILFGTVAYDGQDQAGNSVRSDTEYEGYGFEAGFTYISSGLDDVDTPVTAVRFALGVDAWERNLLGAGGYTEDYLSTYGRIAAVYRAKRQKWKAEFGMKLPIGTWETVDLSAYGFVDEVNLKPKARPSPYLCLSFQLNKRFALKFGYDGYLLNRSNEDRVYNEIDGNYYLIHQPKSEMRTLTAAVSLAL